MNVYVYYSLVNTEMPDKDLWRYLDLLPAPLQSDVRRYKHKADQVRTLTGKLLLKEAMVQMGLPQTLDSIKYTGFKRPFIAHNIDFNITHSGNCVACAIGYDMQLGIDVEEVKAITSEDIIPVLRDEELEEMRRANASAETILRFWTRKEAIIKASGEGLYRQPQDIHFIDELSARTPDNNWFLHALDFGSGYIAYCATNIPGVHVVVKNRPIDQLAN